MDHMTCYNSKWNQVMSVLFYLFLSFRSHLVKLKVYIPTFYKITYILEELYVAVLWIISQLIVYIDQLNEAKEEQIGETVDWPFLYYA